MIIILDSLCQQLFYMALGSDRNYCTAFERALEGIDRSVVNAASCSPAVS